MFSRQHYVAVAELLRDANLDRDARSRLVSDFETLFSEESDRFDSHRFREAVYGGASIAADPRVAPEAFNEQIDSALAGA